MADKREKSLTVRLNKEEEEKVRELALRFEMDISEVLRVCICLATPILEHVPFIRRTRLDDNTMFYPKQ